MFESNVISYSSKTFASPDERAIKFESNVNSYSSKTIKRRISSYAQFESNVNSYSSKTSFLIDCTHIRLRVVQFHIVVKL